MKGGSVVQNVSAVLVCAHETGDLCAHNAKKSSAEPN